MDDALLQELYGARQGNESAGFTDEDVAAHFIPGFTQQDAPPPPPQRPSMLDLPAAGSSSDALTGASPQPQSYQSSYAPADQAVLDVVAPAATAPTAPTTQAASPTEPLGAVGVKQNAKGYSEEKNAQIQKGPAAALAQKQAAVGQQVGEETKALIAMQREAADGEKAAVDAAASAQTEFDIEKAGQDEWLASKQKEFAANIEQEHLKSSMREKQAQTQYVAALNDFRASRVNPSQLWDNMSGGQRVGVLAGVFVHDYLNIKYGIKTSSNDILNKAIDRNIDAQIQNIKIKGDVAQGFKQLWDMERSTSASDAEARAKVRGYMIEGFKGEVEAHMGKFTSGLNEAKKQAAMAAIDSAQAKNTIDVFKHMTDREQSLRAQNIQQYGLELNNSQAAWGHAIDAKRLKLEEKKQKAAEKATGPKDADFIVDPETNQVRWVFKDGTSQPVKDDVKNRAAGLENVARDTETLRKLARSLDPDLDGAPRRMTNEESRLYEATRVSLAKNSLAARGERATDKDMEQELTKFPRETVLTNGGVDRILASTQAGNIQNYQAFIRQHTHDVVNGPQGANGQILNGTLIDAKNAASGSDKVLTPAQTDLKTNAQLATGPAALKRTDIAPGEVPAYVLSTDEFNRMYPDQAKALAKAKASENGPTPQGQQDVSNVELGVARLYAAAERGHQESKDRLAFLAEDFRRGGSMNQSEDYLGALASSYLQKLEGGKYVAPLENPVTSPAQVDPGEANRFLDALGAPSDRSYQQQ